MMRDLFDAFGRHSPTTEHVGEEGADVAAALWTAEGNDENGDAHLQAATGNLSISNGAEDWSIKQPEGTDVTSNHFFARESSGKAGGSLCPLRASCRKSAQEPV